MNKITMLNKKIRQDDNVLWFIILFYSLVFFAVQMMLWRSDTEVQEKYKYLTAEIMLLIGAHLQYGSITQVISSWGRNKTVTYALRYLPLGRREIFWGHVKSIAGWQAFWLVLLALSYLANRHVVQMMDGIWVLCLILNPIAIVWQKEGRILFKTLSD